MPNNRRIVSVSVGDHFNETAGSLFGSKVLRLIFANWGVCWWLLLLREFMGVLEWYYCPGKFNWTRSCFVGIEQRIPKKQNYSIDNVVSFMCVTIYIYNLEQWAIDPQRDLVLFWELSYGNNNAQGPRVCLTS